LADSARDNFDAIDMVDIISIAAKRWIVLLVAPVVIGAGVFIFISMKPPAYIATANVPLTGKLMPTVVQSLLEKNSESGTKITLSNDGLLATITATESSLEGAEEGARSALLRMSTMPFLDDVQRAVASEDAAQLSVDIAVVKDALEDLQRRSKSDASLSSDYDPATFSLALVTMLDRLRAYEAKERELNLLAEQTVAASATIPVITRQSASSRISLTVLSMAGAFLVAVIWAVLSETVRRRRKHST